MKQIDPDIIPELVEWLLNRAIPIDTSDGRPVSSISQEEVLTATLEAFNKREVND